MGQTETPLSKPHPLSLAILSLYRGWRDFEYLSSNGDIEASGAVIAQDVVDRNIALPNVFKNREDIVERLQDLSLQVSKSDFPDEIKDATLTKIASSLRFLRRPLMPDLDDITSQGFPVFEVKDHELDEGKERVRFYKHKCRESKGWTEQELDHYLSCRVPNNQLPKIMEHEYQRFLPILLNWLGVTLKVDFCLELIDHPSKWGALTHTQDDLTRVIVNGSLSKRFDTLTPRFLALHEICGHVVHVYMLRENVAILNKFPHAMMINPHTYDALCIEGIAKLLHWIALSLSEEETSWHWLEFERQCLIDTVTYKCLIERITKGITPSNATQTHMSYIGGDADSILRRYEFLFNSPIFSIHGLAYQAGWKVLQPLISGSLNSNVKPLITTLITTPQTPLSMSKIASQSRYVD